MTEPDDTTPPEGDAFIETGPDGVPEPSDEEKAEHEAAETELKSPEELREDRERERAEQQERAGQDPDDDPLPLSESGNLGAPVVTETATLTVTEQAQINALPSAGTVEDAAGVERLVVTNIDQGWKPARVDPDPKEVARLERINAALEEKKQERLDALKVV